MVCSWILRRMEGVATKDTTSPATTPGQRAQGSQGHTTNQLRKYVHTWVVVGVMGLGRERDCTEAPTRSGNGCQTTPIRPNINGAQQSLGAHTRATGSTAHPAPPPTHPTIAIDGSNSAPLAMAWAWALGGGRQAPQRTKKRGEEGRPNGKGPRWLSLRAPVPARPGPRPHLTPPSRCSTASVTPFRPSEGKKAKYSPSTVCRRPPYISTQAKGNRQKIHLRRSCHRGPT
jgi:hypothetical protein